MNEDRLGRFWLSVNSTDRAGRAVGEPFEISDKQRGVLEIGRHLSAVAVARWKLDAGRA